jgi:DNA invertase Pin-like site-specific DNA recombinase
MHAAAYIRVSSVGQDLRLQRHSIDAAAQARGDLVSYHLEKRSGTTLARPVLDALRADVRGGRVKRLYVFRLDRLTRSGIRDTFELLDELRRHGCSVVTCSDGFDLDGPMAEPLIAMMAWAAQMENHARRERQAAAYARKAAAGESWGRPRRMNEAQESRALKLHQAGHTQREIAVRLKVPHRTVGRALARLLGSKSTSKKRITAHSGK